MEREKGKRGSRGVIRREREERRRVARRERGREKGRSREEGRRGKKLTVTCTVYVASYV